MTTTTWTWLIIVVIYLAFFSWYTSFEGPMTEAEIGHYLELSKTQDPDSSAEDLARIRAFMEEDTGDDFVMINVVHLYDTPLQIDGVAPVDTTDDVLAKYMEYMLPAMLSRASHPVFQGPAVSPDSQQERIEGCNRIVQGPIRSSEKIRKKQARAP